MANAYESTKPTRAGFLTAAASLIVLSACSTTGRYANASPANTIGDWNVKKYKNTFLLQLNIHSPRGLDSNQFLTAGQQVGFYPGTNPLHAVRFSVVRDAGTFECAGKVAGKRGYGGILSFVPNQAFLNDKTVREPNEQDSLLFALFDVDRQTIVKAIKANPSISNRQIVDATSTQRFLKQNWNP